MSNTTPYPSERTYCVAMAGNRNGLSDYEADDITSLRNKIIEHRYDEAHAKGDFAAPEVDAFWVEDADGNRAPLSADKLNEELDAMWPHDAGREQSDYAQHNTYWGHKARAAA